MDPSLYVAKPIPQVQVQVQDKSSTVSVNPTLSETKAQNQQHMKSAQVIEVSLSEDPTLCLNMIVKNESKIIERLLQSVVGLIDSYCICDTGSTDNTVELIRAFFEKHNIPGKVVVEPFQDFGYNRTFALNAAHDVPNADYLLLLDADMIFQINPNLSIPEFKKHLKQADAYHMFQGSDRFYYKNTRIVRNRAGITYWGVTHEYVNLPSGLNTSQIDKDVMFIRDIGDGGSKSDKFMRDIRLLKKGLETNPNNDRYTFYLANSLKDAGELDEAIETYRKRIEIGGWNEEVWYSYFNIGHCYRMKGDMGNAISSWMDAYQFLPERLENLYHIIHHYRCCGKNRLAYPFYVLAKNELKKNKRQDYLFMEKDVYDYKLDYEMSIVGYYCNTDNYDLAKLSMNVFAYPYLEDHILNNVLSNYKFNTKRIRDWSTSSNDQLIDIINAVGQEKIAEYPDFKPSTPSLLKINENKYVVNVRFVNYWIDPQGKYQQLSTIATKNVVAIIVRDKYGVWRNKNEVFLQYDTSLDGHYVGLEDVRLFSTLGDEDDEEPTFYYNANRGLPDGPMVIETGAIDIVTGVTTNTKFPRIPNQGGVEKNWVFLPSKSLPSNPENATQKMIYGWSPLVIGDIVSENDTTHFVKTHEIATPRFFKNVRGSTNGVVIGNEIWLLCHVVSYEDRRYYYHMTVVLDLTTYQLKRYTELYTFDKEKVEYTLGFIHQSATDEFLIGYSTMDCTTNYITIPMSKMEELMIKV
jgi:glycosyltransferase involved in cell wall biosynthesis